MLFTLFIFIAVLAVLVLVHELGHFWAARKFGCGVEEFGFGFPPRITGWRSPKSGVLYSLNWIPLGGFVKIKGEDGSDRDDSESFGSKPAWQRAIILAAGVTMNFVLAAVVLSVGFGFGLPTALPDSRAELGPLATIRDSQIVITLVTENSPAAAAGFHSGDSIIDIDGVQFLTLGEAQEYIAAAANQSMTVTIVRDHEPQDIDVTPVYQADLGRVAVGFGLTRTGIVSYPWYAAPIKGTAAAWNMLVAIVTTFASLLHDLFTGTAAGVDVSGPVGIAVVTGQVARMGWAHLLEFMALLSINLAVINVLPFPALDGGRLIFLLVEKIRRQPVNAKIEALVHNIGFGLLMMLIVFVTYRDIVRWGGGLWEKLVS